MRIADLVRMTGPHPERGRDGKLFNVWRVTLMNRETRLTLKVYTCLSFDNAMTLTECIIYDRGIRGEIESEKRTA